MIRTPLLDRMSIQFQFILGNTGLFYKYPLIYSNSYTCIHNISDMQNIHRQKKTFNKDNLNDNYNHNV